MSAQVFSFNKKWTHKYSVTDDTVSKVWGYFEEEIKNRSGARCEPSFYVEAECSDNQDRRFFTATSLTEDFNNTNDAKIVKLRMKFYHHQFSDDNSYALILFDSKTIELNMQGELSRNLELRQKLEEIIQGTEVWYYRESVRICLILLGLLLAMLLTLEFLNLFAYLVANVSDPELSTQPSDSVPKGSKANFVGWYLFFLVYLSIPIVLWIMLLIGKKVVPIRHSL